jgi:hypothetical protein
MLTTGTAVARSRSRAHRRAVLLVHQARRSLVPAIAAGPASAENLLASLLGAPPRVRRPRRDLRGPALGGPRGPHLWPQAQALLPASAHDPGHRLRPRRHPIDPQLRSPARGDPRAGNLGTLAQRPRLGNPGRARQGPARDPVHGHHHRSRTLRSLAPRLLSVGEATKPLRPTRVGPVPSPHQRTAGLVS